VQVIKLFKYIGIVLATVIGGLAVLIGFLQVNIYFDNVHGQEALGVSAQTLTLDGFTFRDLNKNGALDVYEDTRAEQSQRIDNLISLMTVEEKAGLMFHPQMMMGEEGKVIEKTWLLQMIYPMLGAFDAVGGKLLSHFNIVGTADATKEAQWHNALQALAEKTRMGIPITFSSDPRHGSRNNMRATSIAAESFSRWPEPIGLAATGDEALVESFGRIAREEYRAVGIRVALHPMADLATEPRWARIVGTFGEDADLSARMIGAYVKGFQGAEINTESVITMTKHFSGGGAQKDGLDAHFPYGKEQAYPGDNFDYHLIPFESAFAAGTGQIMPYYGVPMDQTPENVAFAYNRYIITDLLRNKYQFDGVVCSDWAVLDSWLTIGYFGVAPARSYGVEDLSVEERIVKMLDAGIDQFGGSSAVASLINIVHEKRISESRLDESVRRLLRDKFRLGLFDQPYVDVEAAAKSVGTEAYIAAGEKAQRQSIVLLKNSSEISTPQQAVLPLARGSKVYVENVDESVASEYGSVVNNLEEADYAIVRIAAPFENHNGLAQSLVDLLLESLFHQGRLDFPQEELDRLLAIADAKPTVFIIHLDRPAVIPELTQAAAGLLAEFGANDRAVLDLVYGEFNPVAKLPFELPSSVEAVEKQKEDVPYDSEDPLFEFGYGLTYSQLDEGGEAYTLSKP